MRGHRRLLLPPCDDELTYSLFRHELGVGGAVVDAADVYDKVERIRLDGRVVALLGEMGEDIGGDPSVDDVPSREE